MATQNRQDQQQAQQPQRDRQRDQPLDQGTVGNVRDGATDRGGTGGYGASSGFSDVTTSGTDQYGGDQRDQRDQRDGTTDGTQRDGGDADVDSNANRDVGMRGRDTGRGDGESMR